MSSSIITQIVEQVNDLPDDLHQSTCDRGVPTFDRGMLGCG